jgi:hypothetical protein
VAERERDGEQRESVGTVVGTVVVKKEVKKENVTVPLAVPSVLIRLNRCGS